MYHWSQIISRGLSVTLGLGLLLGGVTPAEAAPRWIRLSWTQAPATSLTVTWNDNGAVGQAEIRPLNGAATTVTSTGLSSAVPELDYTHTVEFTGLQPDTAYEYRVQSQATWSPWTITRTAPSAGDCTPITFVATGDNRGEDLWIIGYNQSGQWPGVMSALISENPLFALHSGDFVYDGGQISQWQEELDSLPEIAALFPFFLAQGNHDDGPGEGAGAHYNQIFTNPATNPDGVEDYYGLIMGNVQVICLSTHSFDIGDQIAWMDSELTAHAGSVDWRVVFFHVPIWSSGAHGSDESGFADIMLPVLESHGVDLVINGHDHDYERFHPSLGGHGAGTRIITPLPFDNNTRGEANGPIYIVTGGGGALLNPIFSSSEVGSAVGASNLNYVVVRANGNALRVTARDMGPCVAGLCGTPTVAGNLDDFTLEKSNTICTGTTPDAGVPDPDATVPDGGTADGGPDPSDAGPADDGGLPQSDAGTPSPDGSTQPPATPDSGCSCQTPPGAGNPAPVLLLVLLFWLFWRRRR